MEVMERLLTWFDQVMDFVSFGAWSRWQGEKRVYLRGDDK